MDDPLCWTGVLEVQNGLSAPLYAEGQVVRAEDLTLDRSAHDRELWRLRRYLHGWGVVAGLVVELEEDQVVISAGYGICPSGEEVYLPEDVVIANLSAAILSACGPLAPTCALEETAARIANDDGAVEVWLIAAPMITKSDPRPAWPRDCDHPGNHLAPARSCGGVRFGFACEEPARHGVSAKSCEEMRELLCRGRPLYLPEEHPAPGLLVLAKLGLRDGILSVDTSVRRPLFPVSVLQDFVIACGCRQAEEIIDQDDTTAALKPDVADEAEPAKPKADDRYDWFEIAKIVKKREKARIKVKTVPDEAGPVIAPAEALALAKAGLTVEGLLSTTSHEAAVLANMTEQRIDEIKVSIARASARFSGPGF